jgi:heme O synthase-like polyprenyltransferase
MPASKPKINPFGMLGYLWMSPVSTKALSHWSGMYGIVALFLIAARLRKRASLCSVVGGSTAGALVPGGVVTALASVQTLPVQAEYVAERVY